MNYEHVASKEMNDKERKMLLAYWPYINSLIVTRRYDTWYNSQIITNAYPSTRNVFGARVLLVLSTVSLSFTHTTHNLDLPVIFQFYCFFIVSIVYFLLFILSIDCSIRKLFIIDSNRIDSLFVVDLLHVD